MLKLYGFAASNYYNKVKLALMEKGIPFEEALRWPDQTDGDLSPLHKVPYMVGEDGGCANRRSSSITSRRAIRGLR